MNFQTLADREKGLPLSFLGALPVADMKRGRVVIAGCQRSTYARIHTATEQHDCPAL
jgi:hypothetical protein